MHSGLGASCQTALLNTSGQEWILAGLLRIIISLQKHPLTPTGQQQECVNNFHATYPCFSVFQKSLLAEVHLCFKYHKTERFYQLTSDQFCLQACSHLNLACSWSCFCCYPVYFLIGYIYYLLFPQCQCSPSWPFYGIYIVLLSS